MLVDASERFRGPALSFRDAGRWIDVTYVELGHRARDIARGLIALGVEPGDRVSVLSNTRPEWTFADAGIMFAGATLAPVYHTNAPEECRYILAHADARVVFCEDAEQLAKIREVRDKLPALRQVIAFRGAETDPDAISVEELVERGEEVDPNAPERALSQVAPTDVATIIYTSGTTGPPKGCEITHENWVFTVRAYERHLALDPPIRTFMFLPLAHSLARVIQLFVLDQGGTLVFWGLDSSRLIDDLAETRPTYLPSVPRVFEKVHTRVLAEAGESGMRKRLVDWAVGVGSTVTRLQDAGRTPPATLRLRHRLADRLVLGKVRALFGGELKAALSGAAPISREVLEFFDACGIPIAEGYGMSETSAAGAVNSLSERRLGSIGKVLPGTELKIAEDGEILMRGPHVMRGYLKDPAATAAAFDEEGWLHSGDLGSIDEDGFVYVTGRKKDLIITSSGKNISPANIESALRDSRWISQAVVFGDERPYLVALITLDPEELPALAEELGIDADPAAMHQHPEVIARIAAVVDEVNAGLARIEQVKRFSILDRDLTQEDGELTPTLKVKRALVYRRFAEEFAALYE
jgi:long-chain acyl-CoA synthetase